MPVELLVGSLDQEMRLQLLPSGFASIIQSQLTTSDRRTLEEAFAPMSVSITLEDDIDISKGRFDCPFKQQT